MMEECHYPGRQRRRLSCTMSRARSQRADGGRGHILSWARRGQTIPLLSNFNLSKMRNSTSTEIETSFVESSLRLVT